MSLILIKMLTYHVHGLRLLLVAHRDDGQHEVDEVERAEEHHDCEEYHMNRSSCCHNLNNNIY